MEHTQILSRGTYTQNVPIYLWAWSSDPNFSHQAVRVAFDNFIVTPYRSMSGRITLQGAINQAQPVTFEFRPIDGSETFTRTLTLNANRTYALTGIPAKQYNVWIKADRWLSKVVTVNMSNGSASSINATLSAGDANNDNFVDVLDLAALIEAFDSVPEDGNWIAGADFNADDIIDVLDLDLLIVNFDQGGDA